MIKVSISEKMKAISILMVIAGHMLGDYFTVNPYLRMILGTGGVTVFFMLSGYGVAASYLTKGITGSYWINKIRKVMIPYWIITILYFLVMGYYKLGFTVLLKNLLFVDFQRKLDRTMWYLSFLIIWYILFWLIFRFKYSIYLKILLLLIPGVWFFLHEQSDLFLDCAWQFSRNALSFPLGVILGLFTAEKHPGILERNLLRIVLLAAVTGGIVLYYFTQTDGRLFTQINGVFVFVFLFILCPWIENCRWLTSILDRIGEMSYIMYLIEAKWFFIVALLGIQGNRVNALAYFISFAVLIAAIYFCKTLIMRKRSA